MNNGVTATNEFEVESWVDSDHPALAGHLPDEPLVPGVMVLECVAAAAERTFGFGRLIAIPVVKFLAPLRPDERFRIALSRSEDAGITFECRRQATVLARGRLIRAD